MFDRETPRSADLEAGQHLLLNDGRSILLEQVIHESRRQGWETVVFSAKDARDQRYAVKWYGGPWATDIERAKRGANRAAAIGQRLGPEITAEVVDLIDGRHLVTRWIDAPSLSRLLAAERIARKEGWAWLERIAVTLVRFTETLTPFAPDCGHGDVQPTNILMSNAGVRLIDLDYVARAVPRPRPTAQTLAWTESAGRRAFKSPEYVLGTNRLDSRSDVFSFGLLAYWLLNSQPAFAAEDEYRKRLEALADGKPAGHPAGVANLEQGPVRDWLLSMTAFDPTERCPSMREALRALRTIRARRRQGRR